MPTEERKGRSHFTLQEPQILYILRNTLLWFGQAHYFTIQMTFELSLLLSSESVLVSSSSVDVKMQSTGMTTLENIKSCLFKWENTHTHSSRHWRPDATLLPTATPLFSLLNLHTLPLSKAKPIPLTSLTANKDRWCHDLWLSWIQNWAFLLNRQVQPYEGRTGTRRYIYHDTPLSSEQKQVMYSCINSMQAVSFSKSYNNAPSGVENSHIFAIIIEASFPQWESFDGWRPLSHWSWSRPAFSLWLYESPLPDAWSARPAVILVLFPLYLCYLFLLPSPSLPTSLFLSYSLLFSL